MAEGLNYEDAESNDEKHFVFVSSLSKWFSSFTWGLIKFLWPRQGVQPFLINALLGGSDKNLASTIELTSPSEQFIAGD